MFNERKPPTSERLLPILGRAGVEPLLDSHAAAAVLGVHPRTLQRMVLCGQIAGSRLVSYGTFALLPSTWGSTASKLAKPKKPVFSAD